MSNLTEIVGRIVKILDDKKARDIIALSVKNLTTITDSFIIATGGSKSQLQALADHIEEELIKEGIRPKNREGYNTAEWILLGYDDVIVHIFKEETRQFYNLEHIWKDAEDIDISQFISNN